MSQRDRRAKLVSTSKDTWLYFAFAAFVTYAPDYIWPGSRGVQTTALKWNNVVNNNKKKNQLFFFFCFA